LARAIRSFIHAACSNGPSAGSAIRSPRMLTRSCQRLTARLTVSSRIRA